MDTNNIKSLDRLPEGVTVTSEGVISCTRDALNHLGDWCKKNAGALAISVFATTGVNAALAGTPAYIADTQSPSATLQATKGLEYGQITNNGKKFESLTEQEVDSLSRPEKKAYYAWKNTQIDQAAISRKNEEVKIDQAAISRKNEEVKIDQAAIEDSTRINRKKEAAIEDSTRINGKKEALIAEYKKTLSNFITLYSSGKTDSDIFKGLKDSLLNILKTGEPDEVIAAIKKDPRIEKAIRA